MGNSASKTLIVNVVEKAGGLYNPSKESHKSVSIYKNVKMVNRANNLKDKIQRHHSQSGIISRTNQKNIIQKKKINDE